MADNPIDPLAQAVAALAAVNPDGKRNETVSHKGIIKDSEKQPTSSLSPEEESRLVKGSKIFAGAILEALLGSDFNPLKQVKTTDPSSEKTDSTPPKQTPPPLNNTKVSSAISQVDLKRYYNDSKPIKEETKPLPNNIKQTVGSELSLAEQNRYKAIATIFGNVLRIGAFKLGPEAGRLTAPQSQKVAPAAIKDKIKPAQTSGSDLAKLLAGLLGLSLFDGFWDAIKRWLATNLAKFLIQPFKRVMSWVGKQIWRGIKWVGGQIWRGIKYLGKKLWGWADSLKNAIKNTKWFTGLKNKMKSLWFGIKVAGLLIWDGIKWVGKQIWRGIKYLGKKLWGWAGSLKNAIKKTKWFTGFMDRVKAAKDGLKSTWDDAINAVKGYIEDVAKYITNFKNAALNALKRIPGYNLVKKGMEKTSELAAKGAEKAKAAKTAIAKGATAVKGAATDLAEKGATKIAEKAAAVKGAATEAAEEGAKKIAEKATAIKGAAGDLTEQIAEKAAEKAKTAKAVVKGAADDATEAAVKYGKGKISAYFGKFFKGGAKLLGGWLRKVPIIGPVVEGLFAAHDIKKLKESHARGEITLEELQYQAGRRVGTGVAALGGAAIGGVLGSLLGPVGTILGGIGGDILARWGAGLLMDKVLSRDITSKLGSYIIGQPDGPLLWSKDAKVVPGEMQDFIVKGNNVYKFSSQDEVLGMKTGGAIGDLIAGLKESLRKTAFKSRDTDTKPVLAKSPGQIINSLEEELMKKAEVMGTMIPRLLATTMGWKTLAQFRDASYRINPELLKGVEESESPGLLRDAQALGWKTVKEYSDAQFKPNPAIAEGLQAATPAASTTTASFAEAAATPLSTPTPTLAPGQGVAPGQIASGLQAAYNQPITPSSGAPLNQDIKANIAAVMEAVKAKGFTNEKYLAAVYGNVMKETGGKIMAENMNYSTTSNARIRSIFGSRVAGMSDAQINQLKSTPESFGNAMYGGHTTIGRNLGNVEPGDGFKFRGRGFVQLTGRAAYAKASKAIFGDDRLVQNPDLVLDRQVGALVTAWELEDRKSWAGKYGIDYNNMTQEQANMLVTSKIAGQRVTRGRGYLGGLLTKVDAYSRQYNSADYAGIRTGTEAPSGMGAATSMNVASAPAATSTGTPAPLQATASAPAAMPAPSGFAASFANTGKITTSPNAMITKESLGTNGRINTSSLISIGKGHMLHPIVARKLQELTAAAARDGINLYVTDSYRTYQQQHDLVDWPYHSRTGKYRKKGTGGSIPAARPGTSRHGWGIAVDLGPSSAYPWLAANARKYGWANYRGQYADPGIEPWHWQINIDQLSKYATATTTGGAEAPPVVTGTPPPTSLTTAAVPAGAEAPSNTPGVSLASPTTPATGPSTFAAAAAPAATVPSVVPDSTGSSLSSQFQPQQIAMPAASGGPVTTTWSGGESNFNINGANMGGLNSEFRRRLESMAAEYKQKTGKKINVSGARSAYRTYEQQLAIYKTVRRGYAATPGTSNHGFGFALDINTADANRADSLGLLAKYGLHRPMMSKSLYEPWHLEPVGLNKAALAQYRARRESGKFSGDQLAFALGGSGSSGPPYTEQSVTPVAGAIAATPVAGAIAATPVATPSVANTSSGSSVFGGLFSGISNLFSSGPTAQSADGGISNLSTSSTSPPMIAAGAETSITNKMEDVAKRQETKADREIGLLQSIDNNMRSLSEQLIALSRGKPINALIANNDNKTNITSANIPDTNTRLGPQTGGTLGGKMFGFVG